MTGWRTDLTTPARPGLGWLPDPDPRNDDHPMRAVLRDEPRAARPTRHVWDFPGRKLNQGSTGTCVGHAGKGHLMSAPVQRSFHDDPPSAFDLYDLACTLDGFAQNDRDVDPGRTFGTTINALMKAMRQLGLISEWRWASSLDDLLDWLAFRGPVVFGVDWFDGFFVPDAEGFVTKRDTSTSSGHAFVVVGYDLTHPRPHLVCVNSWGNAWGADGTFRIELPLAEDLVFQRHGEAAAALEVDPTPPAPEPEPTPPSPEPEEPPVPDDVFFYPYQEALTVGEALARGLLTRERATSRSELIYLFRVETVATGTRFDRAWTLLGALDAGVVEGLGADGHRAGDPTGTYLVHRVEARHRPDWNA